MKNNRSFRKMFTAVGLIASLGVAAPILAQDQDTGYRSDIGTTDRDFDWGWLGLLGLAGLLGLRHRRIDTTSGPYTRTGV